MSLGLRVNRCLWGFKRLEYRDVVPKKIIGLPNHKKEVHLSLCQFATSGHVFQPLITNKQIIEVVPIISIPKHSTMYVVGHLDLYSFCSSNLIGILPSISYCFLRFSLFAGQLDQILSQIFVEWDDRAPSR
jgi:hypothetical protein